MIMHPVNLPVDVHGMRVMRDVPGITESEVSLEQLAGGIMRFGANDRVGAQQVVYVFNAVLAHLFGFAESSAHTDDCA